MNAALAELTPEELARASWWVDLAEQAGGMDEEEAGEWQRRVLAWQAYLHLGASGEPS